MIKRVVKMTFQPEMVDSFLEMFKEIHPLIEKRDGCKNVELYIDEDSPNVIFTLSLWNNIDSLEAYRQSELFKEIWPKTKLMFKERAQAWSLKKF